MFRRLAFLIFGVAASNGCGDGYVISRHDAMPAFVTEDLPDVDFPLVKDVFTASLAGRDYTRKFLRMKISPDDALSFLQSRAQYLKVPIADWIVIAEPAETVPEWVLVGELKGYSVSGSYQVPNPRFQNAYILVTERWSYQGHSGELFGRITKVR